MTPCYTSFACIRFLNVHLLCVFMLKPHTVMRHKVIKNEGLLPFIFRMETFSKAFEHTQSKVQNFAINTVYMPSLCRYTILGSCDDRPLLSINFDKVVISSPIRVIWVYLCGDDWKLCSPFIVCRELTCGVAMLVALCIVFYFSLW